MMEKSFCLKYGIGKIGIISLLTVLFLLIVQSCSSPTASGISDINSNLPDTVTDSSDSPDTLPSDSAPNNEITQRPINATPPQRILDFRKIDFDPITKQSIQFQWSPPRFNGIINSLSRADFKTLELKVYKVENGQERIVRNVRTSPSVLSRFDNKVFVNGLEKDTKYLFKLILTNNFLMASESNSILQKTATDSRVITRDISAWKKEYYNDYTWRNIKHFAPVHEKIDLRDVDYPLLHATMFFESNLYRHIYGNDEERYGSHPLKWNEGLEIAAYHHSQYFFVNGFRPQDLDLSTQDPVKNPHYSSQPGRFSPSDRAGIAGIRNANLSENILSFSLYQYIDLKAAVMDYTYQEYGEEAIRLWYNSPGHRENLLRKASVELGTGALIIQGPNTTGHPYTTWATQNFQNYNLSVMGESLDPVPPGFR